MAAHPDEIPDPRVFAPASSAPAPARELYALAESILSAETGQRAAAVERELHAALAERLRGDGRALAAAFAAAPSVDVGRCLGRALDAVWRSASVSDGAGVALTVFALPLVLVAGREGRGSAGVLPGVLGDAARLAAILVDGGALAGNRTVALANVLAAATAIDVEQLPAILRWRRLPDAGLPVADSPAVALPPAPVHFAAGRESVHLRFIVGTAIARPGAELAASNRVGPWGMPLAQELSRQFATPDAAVLALPRAPQHLLPASWQGRAAQREVSAQIFASNALRKFRGTVGEPVAVISAHRTADAPGGGELRLSLSSPFEPKEAEGFRCPLYPMDRVGDVVAMLVDLLRDCRVASIRALAGVHDDHISGTSTPLMFKAETIPH